MKKSIVLFIKSFFFTSVLLLFFILYGYLFLTSNATFTEVKEKDVPYYELNPKNTNVKISFLNFNAIYFLDFNTEKLRVLFLDENDNYDYNYTFYLNFEMESFSYLIDLLGGIELNIENECLSYTGTQLLEFFKVKKDELLYKKIIYGIIKKISEKGLVQEDIFYIIKNNETNITIKDCYDWNKYIKNMCNNVLFLN